MTAFKDGSLSALVSLIAKATALVEAHYRASSKPYVPSLDDTEEHPLDKEIWPSEPSRTVVNREMEIYRPYCLNAILRLKVADALLNKPRGMHVSELASLVQTDANN
ncbi:hypothetical protein BKA70DRAFT_1425551 [Coprinopsis sp. MPI-PUGE-AT-0042]|nr:hypothetical protein BKA70DRAFT_1425551 [Coprinopsis sp. MPI-PUGE-AT-0042]